MRQQYIKFINISILINSVHSLFVIQGPEINNRHHNKDVSMDRRDFLKLMIQAGVLAAMGNIPVGCGSKGGGTPDPGPLVDYKPRKDLKQLTPYLVMPRLDEYSAAAPEWQNWAGMAWNDVQHGPHGFWFLVPEVNQSVDVVVPVINLGNLTTRHLVIELYEGPHMGEMPLSSCELRDRRGPFTLHPGVITGFPMRFTRKRSEGASVAICYDPFFDPIHDIGSVGALAANRKNLGNCNGIRPPGYPGYYGF
jgi:hypothetical protein